MPTLLAIEALEADRMFVERNLKETPNNPWGTTRLMWQNRLAEIDRLIAETARQRSNYASVALIFDGVPVIGSNDIRLDFAANALDSYQKIISLSLAAKLAEDLPQKGPLPGSDRSRLFIRDLVRGSMGFILEELAPEQEEMLPSVLKDAVENSTNLLSVFSNAADEAFESTLQATQPRLVSAVQKFAKLLYEAGASTRIVGDENRLSLSTDDVGSLSKRLNEVEIVEEIEPAEGVLLGILPESRQFELRPLGDDGTIKGTISEDLALKYTADAAFKERLLLQPVMAQIKHIKTMRNGRFVREQRVLEAVEPKL